MSHPRPFETPGAAARSGPGAPAGAIVAAIVLLLGGGAAALLSAIVLPFASDPCGDTDRQLICTAGGQQTVALLPLIAAAAGILVAGGSCFLKPPYRAVGITLGYLIVATGILVAFSIAAQV